MVQGNELKVSRKALTSAVVVQFSRQGLERCVVEVHPGKRADMRRKAKEVKVVILFFFFLVYVDNLETESRFELLKSDSCNSS